MLICICLYPVHTVCMPSFVFFTFLYYFKLAVLVLGLLSEFFCLNKT